jgi:hypothetical protein
MARETVRDVVRSLERAAPVDQWTMLCFLAGQRVELDADERNAAVRRAELLLATGGDPRRKVELFGRAVTAVAEDLDSEAARAQLGEGLAALRAETEGLRGAGEALRLLQRDPDLAWQCFACALIAEELAAEGVADAE